MVYYNLYIGGIDFQITSERELELTDSLAAYLKQGPGEKVVSVHFLWDHPLAPRPSTPMLGEDMIQEFYRQDGKNLCRTKDGWGGYTSAAVYDDTCREVTCYVDTKPSIAPPSTLGAMLRLLPMRAILQRHRVIFFHGSQIALGGTGILFTAPSGTGKTTQAKLWKQYRGARIICNDRTLVCGGVTYGYPMDGSEPIRSGEINRLGAVVVLGQHKENRIRRLKPSEGLAKLMPQTVIDGWNSNALRQEMDLLLDLMMKYPVYYLECTPDEDAVRCLERQLKCDGVI